MMYKTAAQKYMDFSSYKGFLIGDELSEDLDANKNSFKDIYVRTCTQIISNTKNRYNELLKVYKKKKVTK